MLGGHHATKHVFAGTGRIASKLIPVAEQVALWQGGDDPTSASTLPCRTARAIAADDCRMATVPARPSQAQGALRDETYYYHPDHLGSMSWMTDHSGRVHEHVEYYPYGEVWRDSRLDDDPGPQPRTPAYLFTSKEYDPETRLYYFGARYYDARTSRWESTDPVLAKYLGGTGQNSIHQPKTLSLFSYAQFNPVHLIDPDGREPNRSQATTAAGVRAIIEQHFASGAVSLQALRYTEGAKGGGKQVGPFGGGKGGRYVWTTQRGWIDLGHFFQVGAEAQKELGNGWKKGIAGGIGRAYTEHKLWEMTKKVENSQHGETRWSYEDPSSNKAGLDFFLDYYHGDKTLLADLDRFFKDAGAGNPRGAPNWKVMQKDQQEQHWFEPTDSIDPVLNPKRVDPKHPPPERTVD